MAIPAAGFMVSAAILYRKGNYCRTIMIGNSTYVHLYMLANYVRLPLFGRRIDFRRVELQPLARRSRSTPSERQPASDNARKFRPLG